MDIQLTTIEVLQDAQKRLNTSLFVQRYPGSFLLAMGFLAVEEIKKERRIAQMTKRATMGSIDNTEAIFLGPRLRHDASESHPLAGCAFFLHPKGEKDSALIGRGMDCEITIPDSSVSENHCWLEATEEGVTVVDKGSTNGTSVNLERLEPREPRLLEDQDILSVGRYSFQLLTSKSMYLELSLLDEAG
jgi:hypothetical protein